jgi:hypothetical protein
MDYFNDESLFEDDLYLEDSFVDYQERQGYSISTPLLNETEAMILSEETNIETPVYIAKEYLTGRSEGRIKQLEDDYKHCDTPAKKKRLIGRINRSISVVTKIQDPSFWGKANEIATGATAVGSAAIGGKVLYDGIKVAKAGKAVAQTGALLSVSTGGAAGAATTAAGTEIAKAGATAAGAGGAALAVGLGLTAIQASRLISQRKSVQHKTTEHLKKLNDLKRKTEALNV